MTNETGGVCFQVMVPDSATALKLVIVTLDAEMYDWMKKVPRFDAWVAAEIVSFCPTAYVFMLARPVRVTTPPDTDAMLAAVPELMFARLP
jgi:hypothetical protein